MPVRRQVTDAGVVFIHPLSISNDLSPASSKLTTSVHHLPDDPVQGNTSEIVPTAIRRRYPLLRDCRLQVVG